MEDLETEIKDLKNAYSKIMEAMNDIKDYDELDEKYKCLEEIAEDINDKRAEKETDLELLRDDEFFEEQYQEWLKDRAQEEKEYWADQFRPGEI